MFEASRPLLLFDHFRVPYRVVGGVKPCGWDIVRSESGRCLYVPRQAEDSPIAEHLLAGIRIFAPLRRDDAVGRLLPDGDSWRPMVPIERPDGTRAASVWRDSHGNVLLPFDPDRAIRALWSEEYTGVGAARRSHGVRHFSLRLYYRVRPILPRQFQIALRRLFSRVQARTKFPRWPVETTLHDLFDWLLSVMANLAGEPVPYIEPWPGGRRWALVLTHDVETALGRDNVHLLRDVEASAGFRSSWNFVPRRYDTPDELVQELRDAGFEVGVHGLHHDGRDLESLSVLEERLPEMQEYGARWGSVGFRSPATHRVWELMPLLGFDYDSSYPDTDPFEPQGGGCCSWWPFFNDDLVELPITLPQDHTLFVILHHDERAWVDKAEFLRGRGGMALLITHPDYMIEAGRVRTYERFLATFAEDDSVWRVLPREVSAWWRRRAASGLERDGRGSWRVVGEAAGDASVGWLEPS